MNKTPEETWPDPALPMILRQSALAWKSYAASAPVGRPTMTPGG
jgi:hypothetical protein